MISKALKIRAGNGKSEWSMAWTISVATALIFTVPIGVFYKSAHWVLAIPMIASGATMLVFLIYRDYVDNASKKRVKISTEDLCAPFPTFSVRLLESHGEREIVEQWAKCAIYEDITTLSLYTLLFGRNRFKKLHEMDEAKQLEWISEWISKNGDNLQFERVHSEEEERNVLIRAVHKHATRETQSVTIDERLRERPEEDPAEEAVDGLMMQLSNECRFNPDRI